MLLDASQDLCAVDLAQHHVPGTHPGDGVEHPPPVAVELGERVQVHVAVVDAHVPAERRGIDPHVAMGELHPLGPRRRARGVVDRRRRRLVGIPRSGLDAPPEEGVVGLVPDHQSPFARHVGQRFVELGVDEQDSGPAVLDDVGDLLGDEPEIDRNENPAGARDPEQRRDQARRVVTDDRHPFAGRDAQGVESGGERPGPVGDLGVREGPPRRRWLVRFVDDADPPGYSSSARLKKSLTVSATCIEAER